MQQKGVADIAANTDRNQSSAVAKLVSQRVRHGLDASLDQDHVIGRLRRTPCRKSTRRGLDVVYSDGAKRLGSR